MSPYGIVPIDGVSLATTSAVPTPGGAQNVPEGGFGAILMRGLGMVNARLENADALVRRFAIDDSVPIHHVTMALEEARLSIEFAMQVRGRLVESYRDLMNMQL